MLPQQPFDQVLKGRIQVGIHQVVAFRRHIRPHQRIEIPPHLVAVEGQGTAFTGAAGVHAQTDR